MSDASLLLTQDLTVGADHSQIYIYSTLHTESAFAPDEANPYLEALADAVDSRRFVGAATGLVVLMTPAQYNQETPVRLEVWTSEPASDTESWDHEVDIDLDIPDGRLWFEPSGGGSGVEAAVPAAAYRLRVSGKGLDEALRLGMNGPDSYRIQLWVTDSSGDPVLRRYWPGWDTYR